MARILCVEDESAFREDIAAYLRMQSYEVDEAADGSAALRMLQQQPYDVVLCDIMMPGMDGFNLLQTFRTQQLGKPGYDVPFVFLTALSDVSDKVTAQNMGCDDFLSKPIDFKLLAATIENRIARYAQTRIDREMAQSESMSALQAVYAHELMQPAIQLYEVAQYLSGLTRDEAGLKKLDAFLPKMQELSKRQLASIDVLREIENLQQEKPPTSAVSLSKQWLDESARYLIQRIHGLQMHVQYLGDDDQRVVAEPAWMVRAMYYVLDSLHQLYPKDACICRLQCANGLLQIEMTLSLVSATNVSSLMSLTSCVSDRIWRRALNAHWGALHYADAVMRKQSGHSQFQLSTGGLVRVVFGLPLVKWH